MANAINDMERKLNENETHADPNAKTEDMRQQPPSVKPAGRRRRPVKKTPTVKVEAKTDVEDKKKESNSLSRPFACMLPATVEEFLHAAMIQIMQGLGIFALIVTFILIGQTALAALTLLSLIAFLGWRFATYDWVPVETLRRSVESQYGIAVLSVIDSDDVNIPVRLVHEGHRYVIWYANGLNSRVNTTNLIPSRGRIVLTDSNYEVLPAMEVAA